jgi:cellulose synthase/poly-beta-1,6-N-acetylglucosamine synthase-like glycosyltransferase
LIAVIFLVLAAAICLYVVVGYPILLATWKRFAPPVRKDLEFRTSVTVLLAIYNGQEFVRKKLESLLALRYPAELLDILVISDGSTDKSEEIVESFADRKIRLLRVPHGGKASALNAGLTHASGEIIFFTDVRQEIDPEALGQLVANFADPSVGVVTGEVQIFNAHRVGQEADMDLYWRYEFWARRRHSQIDSTLNTTGCLYAVRRSLAEPIPPDTLGDDLFIPQRVLLRGYRIIVEPAAFGYDFAAIHGGEFRRKLRTLAGLWQTCARLPRVFTNGNRMRFHFFCHKVGRLAVPWAVLLALAATIGLPASGSRTTLLGAEIGLIALGLLDRFLPSGFALRRISSPANSFLTMNVAALLSVLVFFVPPEKLWQPTRLSAKIRPTNPFSEH